MMLDDPTTRERDIDLLTLDLNSPAAHCNHNPFFRLGVMSYWHDAKKLLQPNMEVKIGVIKSFAYAVSGIFITLHNRPITVGKPFVIAAGLLAFAKAGTSTFSTIR